MVESSVLLRRALFVMGVLILSLLPLEAPVRGADLDPFPGGILAPVGRQVGWLNLDAPRPRAITNLPSPEYVSDVAVPSISGGLPPAAVAVLQPLEPRQQLPGDL